MFFLVENKSSNAIFYVMFYVKLKRFVHVMSRDDSFCKTSFRDCTCIYFLLFIGNDLSPLFFINVNAVRPYLVLDCWNVEGTLRNMSNK